MLEPKKRTALNDADVIAKKEAALTWCKNASEYASKHKGKPWIYALIPHDVISENITLDHFGKG